MSVSVAATFKMDVTEVPGSFIDLATAPSFVHKATNVEAVSLTSATTPAVTAVWSDSQALSGGAATIDLTSLTKTGLSSEDFTGKKVQMMKFTNKSTNSGSMEIATGATNGYAIFGTADDMITLPVGGCVQIYMPEGTPDVASGAKTIDIAGTGTDVFEIILVAG